MMLPGNAAVRKLVEEGVLPRGCFRFELIGDAGEVVKLVTHCYITEQQFRKIADAFMGSRERAREIAELIVYSYERDGKDGLKL